MISRWQSMDERLACWSSVTNQGVEILLAVLAISLTLLIGTQVFFRYALNHSIFWSEEVGRVCLVWLSFLGATAAYHRGAHIGIGFFVERLPKKVQYTLQVLVLKASLAFFAMLTVTGSRFVWFAIGQKTPALGFPKSIPYLVMPVSGLVFMLHGCHHLLKLLLKRHHDETFR